MGRRIGVPYRHLRKTAAYEAALRRVGLDPVLLTPDGRVESRGIGGLLLMGGTDVDPTLYGEPREAATDQPDGERDRYEIALVKRALQADLPLLAICRGQQLLNVALEGTLIQDLHTSVDHSVKTDATTGRHPAVHPVRVHADTKLAVLIGAGEHQVNSRHHQAIKRLAARLRECAVAPDGVIEAVEVEGRRFALAVQWHPEDRIEVSEADLRLFEAFAAAVEDAAR